MMANFKWKTDNAKPTKGVPVTGCRLSVVGLAMRRRRW
jgi:hypothetical protein